MIFAYGMFSIAVTFSLWRTAWEIKATWYAYLLTVSFSPFLAQILLLFEIGRQKRKTVRIYLFVITALMIAIGVLSSRLNYVIVPIVSLGLANMAETGKASKKLALMALVFLIVLNPAKHIYRAISGYRTGEFAQTKIGDMADAWQQSLTTIWTEQGRRSDDVFSKTSSRLNFVNTNATTFYLVPGKVEFEMGTTWLAIPISIVPRFLWSEKPSLNVITADYFAITMGITTRAATERTTSAYPVISDGYWNLGWPGVIFVGAISGIFFALLFGVFNEERRIRYAFALWVVVLMKSTSHISGILVGPMQQLVVCFIVIKALEIMSRRTPVK